MQVAVNRLGSAFYKLAGARLYSMRKKSARNRLGSRLAPAREPQQYYPVLYLPKKDQK